MMPCTTRSQKQGANRNTATNQNHIGALKSDSYETVNGSGGDFGKTMTDHVQWQCTKRTHISRRRSDVEVGGVCVDRSVNDEYQKLNELKEQETVSILKCNQTAKNYKS